MQLELEHISKRYKDKLALEDVCVTMNPGVNGTKWSREINAHGNFDKKSYGDIRNRSCRWKRYFSSGKRVHE